MTTKGMMMNELMYQVTENTFLQYSYNTFLLTLINIKQSLINPICDLLRIFS